MERDELEELHYITHVENLPSIFAAGIGSHRRVRQIEHRSVANPDVQGIRRGKKVPGGKALHDYVNLYMTARNPMLYLLARHRGLLDELAVIRVSPDVLDLDDVVVTDMNAAAGLCRFYPSPAGLANVDGDRVFRLYWTDGDAIEQERCKKAKCAEVLVPDSLSPDYFLGVHVGSRAGRDAVARLDLDISIQISHDLFFN